MDRSLTRTADAARQQWHDVVEQFAARPTLSTAQLAELAEAQWWLGDIAATLALEEQLYDRLVDEGRRTTAAERALRLTVHWGNRGDIAVASAWLARAQRLLRDERPGPVHGYLEYVRASIDLDLDGDPAEGLAAAEHIKALARTHRDPALECFARTVTAFAEIRSGDLRGFETLDEAMLPVIAGKVDPLWAGDIYCSVIHLCDLLGDHARMRAWTDALASWAAPLASTFPFAAVTRIHQLQLLLAEGAWATVLDELAEQSASTADVHGWLAGQGFYDVGEVHRLRGEDDQARAAFARARDHGIEPQPGEAELLRAAGQAEDALAALRIALGGKGPLARSGLILPTVEIALEVGDRPFALQLTQELEQTAGQFATPGLVAATARARAACLTASDRPTDAVPLLEEAARIYRDQRNQHALGRTHEALAEAFAHMGRPDQARAALATALAVYRRLGAAADLRRLAPAPRPGRLTDREAEVLANVASGLTNKQVAAALGISDKTVSRHLDNIFTKLGVSSRTAAAAWAHDHDLA